LQDFCAVLVAKLKHLQLKDVMGQLG